MSPASRLLDDRLAGRLRHAAWMDESGRSASRFSVVDVADLDDTVQLVLASPEGVAEGCYAVVLDTDGNPVENDSVRSARFHELVVDGMRGNRRIQTRHGGIVALDGQPGPFAATTPFACGWSSNDLSLLDLGGVPHVHKRYRALSTSQHEPEVLRRLHGGGTLPAYAGHYAYLDPGGERYALGVVYCHAAGTPLEELLRADLRSLWSELPSGPEASPLVAERTRRFAGVLTAVGASIRRLHDAFATGFAGAGPYPIASCAARTQALLQVVATELRADGDWPGQVREAAAAALTGAVRASTDAPADGRVSVAGGVCHGDLHLAHLLCEQKREGTWTVRVIDVSPRAIDPGWDAFADQTPWEDLVAVRRGLESFAAHEAAVESARLLGTEKRETGRAAVCDAICFGNDLHGEARYARDVRSRLFGVADAWSAAAFQLVLDGYGAADPSRHPLWRLLYLRRLLHELAYNYAHRRGYQVGIDLRFSAALEVGW